MEGLHLTADLHGCGAPESLLADAGALRALALRAVTGAGLAPVGELFHAFAGGGGVTGVVLLAESHLALHTWPEHRAVTLDVYVCNHASDNSARAAAVLAALESAFAATRSERHRVRRGHIAPTGAIARTTAQASPCPSTPST